MFCVSDFFATICLVAGVGIETGAHIENTHLVDFIIRWILRFRSFLDSGTLVAPTEIGNGSAQYLLVDEPENRYIERYH